MKWIDVPPVWLVLCLALAWAQATYLPTPFPDVLGDDVGVLTVIAGVILLVAAARQLRRHRTTIIPHQTASALVTDGIYARSRNPIYLADVFLLVGFSLWWGSVLGLLLAPVFVLVMNRRFIGPEEARLRASFGTAFDTYVERTRRWL